MSVRDNAQSYYVKFCFHSQSGWFFLAIKSKGQQRTQMSSLIVFSIRLMVCEISTVQHKAYIQVGISNMFGSSCTVLPKAHQQNTIGIFYFLLPLTQFSQLFTQFVLCDLAIIMHFQSVTVKVNFERNATGNAEGLQNISFCQTLGDTLRSE